VNRPPPPLNMLLSRHTRRREFIKVITGSAVAAWPPLARAQQPATPVIGYLDSRSPEAVGDRLRGLRQGLKETGYIEGENVAIAYRWAEDRSDRLPALATDLVRLPVAAIVAAGTESTTAAKTAPLSRRHSRIEQVTGMACDHQILIGRYNPH
jgi:putative ABC transport system substrate-binding protein